MSNEGDGLYTYQMSGLTPGGQYNFKIATADWSVNWPGSDARVMANASGEILFRAFDLESWSDGWLPDNARRVGYSDSGLHGWALAGGYADGTQGGMNDWIPDSTWDLTNMGNGLYRGEFLLNPGSYEYKFRKDDNWDISLGSDFGNGAGNIALEVASADTYVFQLDLLNGRHSVAVIPEPASVGVIAGLILLAWVPFARRRFFAQERNSDI